jgi:hypothetical protein
MKTADGKYVHELKADYIHLSRQYLEGIQSGKTSAELAPITNQINDILAEILALEQDLDLVY